MHGNQFISQFYTCNITPGVSLLISKDETEASRFSWLFHRTESIESWWTLIESNSNLRRNNNVTYSVHKRHDWMFPSDLTNANDSVILVFWVQSELSSRNPNDVVNPMTVGFCESLNERRRFLVSIPHQGGLFKKNKQKTREIMKWSHYRSHPRDIAC